MPISPKTAEAARTILEDREALRKLGSWIVLRIILAFVLGAATAASVVLILT